MEAEPTIGLARGWLFEVDTLAFGGKALFVSVALTSTGVSLEALATAAGMGDCSTVFFD